MDVGSKARDALLFPTAIYWPDIQKDDDADDGWGASQLNPATRIDSLDELASPSWDVDGAEAGGDVMWATPRFARGKPPQHIDICWDIQSFSTSALRFLDPDSACRMGSAARCRTDLAMHIRRALEHWSSLVKDFERKYMEAPFGSQIAIRSIECDVRAMQIDLIPEYDFEQQWLSVGELRSLWATDEVVLPEVIGIESLKLKRRLDESVFLVSLELTQGARLFVFKSATFDSKARYLELLSLLKMAPHPNVQPRPAHLVEKRVRFGAKRGVCGFICEYHVLGSLGNLLLRTGRQKPDTATRLQWAREATEALIHVRDSPVGFYPDLKIENLLAVGEPSSDGRHRCIRAQLIDFEDGTPWRHWAPPEVYYVDYIDRLARGHVDRQIQEEYERIMTSLIPDWKVPDRKTKYYAGYQGYNPPWVQLSSEEKESAMAYMLGKLVWYILECPEGISSPVVRESFRVNPNTIAFPTFRETPLSLRSCIRKCTAGAPEWRGLHQPFCIREHKVTPRGKPAASPDEELLKVQRLAREWWTAEVEDAKCFVRSRVGEPGSEKEHQIMVLARQRPKLEGVLDAINWAASELPNARD